MGIQGGDQGDTERTVVEPGKPSFPRTSAMFPSLSLPLCPYYGFHTGWCLSSTRDPSSFLVPPCCSRRALSLGDVAEVTLELLIWQGSQICQHPWPHRNTFPTRIHPSSVPSLSRGECGFASRFTPCFLHHLETICSTGEFYFPRG